MQAVNLVLVVAFLVHCPGIDLKVPVQACPGLWRELAGNVAKQGIGNGPEPAHGAVAQFRILVAIETDGAQKLLYFPAITAPEEIRFSLLAIFKHLAMTLTLSFVSVGKVTFFSCTVVSTTISLSSIWFPWISTEIRKNSFHTPFADAFTEMAEVRWLAGQLPLKGFHPAKCLKVKIPAPLLNHSFIA